MITKGGFTKFLNFMTPDAGVSVQGGGQIDHIYSENMLFS